jgi:hypothetical protein
MVLFGHWCANRARIHTTPHGVPLSSYNSSASAINAMFMMLNIFCISALRAARPALTIPAIQYTIYVLVGFSYGPQEVKIFGSDILPIPGCLVVKGLASPLMSHKL